MSNKKRRKRKRIIIFSLIGVFVLIVGYFVYQYAIEYYRTYYACPGVKLDYYRYPVSGVDVSAHQGTINWSAVHDAEVKFAYIKSTEGIDFLDK
jgi:lysozyme